MTGEQCIPAAERRSGLAGCASIARSMKYRYSDSHNSTISVGTVHPDVSYRVIYCIECEWSASTEEYSRSERSSLAIDHYVETGHYTDTERQGNEAPASGWADEWPPE